MDSFCPACKLPIPPDVNFCPNCGKKIKDPPPSISISAQLVVYFVSLFVPPFGLWYVYKYFKHWGGTDGFDKLAARKKIGYAALILTVISIGFTVWTAQIIIVAVNQALMGLNFQ